MPLDTAPGHAAPPPEADLPEPDPLFVARFKARIDPETAASFTPRQLAAIHRAFALRTLPRHSLDIRRSVPTPWGRMYLAIVAGREKRGAARLLADRARHGAGVVADIALLGLVALLVLMIGAGFLYLAKITIGLDLVPGMDMLPDRELRQFLEN